MNNWKAEIKKWLGDHRLSPIVITSSSKSKQLVDTFQSSRVKPVLIIGYEMYRKHKEVINRQVLVTASII